MTFKRITAAAALGLGALVGLSGPPAQAAYIVTLLQQGPNVVATGSGPLDLTDLGPSEALNTGAILAGQGGLIVTGPTSGTVNVYTGISGPMSFGGGGPHPANTGSGDLVGVQGPGNHSLRVPEGYTSGDPLSDTSTYDNQTFASLGVTPGTYVWTWGTGEDADSFTLKILSSSVPEPAGLLLLPLGLVGVAAARRYRKVGG